MIRTTSFSKLSVSLSLSLSLSPTTRVATVRQCKDGVGERYLTVSADPRTAMFRLAPLSPSFRRQDSTKISPRYHLALLNVPLTFQLSQQNGLQATSAKTRTVREKERERERDYKVFSGVGWGDRKQRKK